ncbi:hypothetical protein PoB_000742600 [Plakobranchus ocellatus]|uniref:Uncharacterized protein n=1 Tax=Plakobranchus ocellatus TaxID=259542 RepID=A0AAV3YET4_9GAST|nr:hypothetical protein PoB_000742600 [Plakobranchus ocellatus]
MSDLDLHAKYLDLGARLGRSGEDLAAWVKDKDEALSIFLSLSPAEGADYQAVKRVLLQRFGCDRNGFRSKFLSVKPQDAEDFGTFLNRAKWYFDRWVELSGVTTLEGLSYLVCSEIALQACDEDFVAYVKDRSPSDMVSLKTVASAYIDARPNKSFRKKHSVSFSARSEPYRPSIRVVDKGNNRSNWPRSQRGVGRSNYASQGHRSPSFQGHSGSGRSRTSSSPSRDRNRSTFNTRSVGKGQQFGPDSRVALVWPPVVETSHVISVVARDMCAVSAQAVQRTLILLIRHLNYLLIAVPQGWVVILEDLSCETSFQYHYVIDLHNRIRKGWRLAQDSVRDSVDESRLRHEPKSKLKHFVPGDEVLVLLPTSDNKLELSYKGPYKVVEKRTSVVYLGDLGDRKCTFHVNLLRKYKRSTYPPPPSDNLVGVDNA